MAKIIKKSNDLAKNYYKTTLKFLGAMGLCILCVAVWIWNFISLKNFEGIFVIPLGALTLTSGIYGYFMKRRSDILRSGVDGEKNAANTLKNLPEGYTVVRNAVVEYKGKSSELDLIVVGKTGVFVVETKNMKGDIYGNHIEKFWTKKKHRGNNIYEDEFYSPVKQVSTHVYRLANFLRKKGVDVFVEGVVYFANPEAVLHIYDSDDGISVLSVSQGRDVLVKHITLGESVLNDSEVKKICKILK